MLSRFRQYDLIANPLPTAYDPLHLHGIIAPFSQRAHDHQDLPTKTVATTHGRTVYDNDGNVIDDDIVDWEAIDWSAVEPEHLNLLYGNGFEKSLHQIEDDGTLSDDEIRTVMITSGFVLPALVSIPFLGMPGWFAVFAAFFSGQAVAAVLNRVLATRQDLTSAFSRAGTIVLPESVQPGCGFQEATLVDFIVRTWCLTLAPRAKQYCDATQEVVTFLHMFRRDPGIPHEFPNSVAINDYRFAMLALPEKAGPPETFDLDDAEIVYDPTSPPSTLTGELIHFLYVCPVSFLYRFLFKGLPLLLGRVGNFAAATVLTICVFPEHTSLHAVALTILGVAFVKRCGLFACQENIHTPLSHLPADCVINYYRSMFTVARRAFPALVLTSCVLGSSIVLP